MIIFPPIWKIKRELLAAYDKVKSLFLYYSSPLWMPLYNRKELSSIEVHDGSKILKQNLVIYLIHQPNGIFESNRIAIDFLASQGYEVMIISNGPMSLYDIQNLKKYCWKIIIRENVGYDFGGYRCGLNFLKNSISSINRLMLVNDSIWFPVIEHSKLIYNFEASVFDFGGAVYLEHEKNNFQSIVLSYWMIFNKNILNKKLFWKFWEGYIPTSNKTLTVKLGERGISRYLMSAGIQVGGIFTIKKFLSSMKSANSKQLFLTLKYGSYTDSSFEKESLFLLNTFDHSENWRFACYNFIERVVKRRNFLHSFCYPSIAMLQVPFIKKNNMRLQMLMRQKYLMAVRSGDLPMPDESILKEIENSTQI
jgi:hypothetical protein